MKTITYRFLIILLFVCLVFANGSAPVFAQTAGSDGGLQVTNAILNLAATPGQVVKHVMTVSIGPQSPALDLTVEARGFGESLSGSFLPASADQDTSPYSGRTWITAIDKPSFHLEPGGQVEVTATITVPADPGTDTHYALIYISSQPTAGQNGVGQILAASVPVVITPPNARLNRTGAITELKVSPIEPGKPIEILTTVKNTGNRHFKVQGKAVITDASGQQVADLLISQGGTSIIPTYSQQLRAVYTAMDRPKGLPAGTYNVEVTITQDDGSSVDSKKISFEVSKPYQPFPGVAEANLLITSFIDQEPGVIDARAQADLELAFEGTGKVTGRVAIGKYAKEPQGAPAFASPIADGGMERTGIKFISVQVDGFSEGLAHLSLQYTDNELGSIDPNSLFLAYKDGTAWRKLGNLSVQSGAQVVKGDLNVAILTKGPLIALGGSGSSAPGGSTTNGLLAMWPYALVGLLVIVVILLIVVILMGRGRAKSAAVRR